MSVRPFPRPGLNSLDASGPLVREGPSLGVRPAAANALADEAADDHGHGLTFLLGHVLQLLVQLFIDADRDVLHKLWSRTPVAGVNSRRRPLTHSMQPAGVAEPFRDISGHVREVEYAPLTPWRASKAAIISGRGLGSTGLALTLGCPGPSEVRRRGLSWRCERLWVLVQRQGIGSPNLFRRAYGSRRDPLMGRPANHPLHRDQGWSPDHPYLRVWLSCRLEVIVRDALGGRRAAAPPALGC